MEAKTVSKEELKNYHFTSQEVLKDHRAIVERNFHLDEAARLGNEHKTKVQLVCETTLGTVVVEATVWAHTDTHIELKSGLDIPVSAIREVIIY
jgi:hypothetical protein